MAPKWKQLLQDYAGTIKEIKRLKAKAGKLEAKDEYTRASILWAKAQDFTDDLTTDIEAEYHDVPGPNRERGIALFWENTGI